MSHSFRRSTSLFVFLFAANLVTFGQGAKISADKDLDNDADRQTMQDNVQAREHWFRANRQIPGERTAELLRRAYSQKQQMQAVQNLFSPVSDKSGLSFTGIQTNSSLATFPGTWTSLGPAPIISDPTGVQDYGKVDGRLTSVAVDQGDATGNTVYIGAAFGGLWKSTNAGPLPLNPTAVTWTQLLDQQPTLAVGAIAIQPGTTGSKAVVLVGTGEPNSSGDSYYGMGILRSIDGGSTWTNPLDSTTTLIKGADCVSGNTGCQESFAGLGFSSFAFSTANPNLVVAGAAATIGASVGAENAQSKRGIYYSTDAGVTWHYANVTDGGSTITPASTPSVAYNPAAGKFFAAVRFHGFYSSSDGINWTRLPSQPGMGLTSTACPTNTATTCPIYRGQIAVKPGSANGEMYVIYVDVNETDQGIFQTINPGSANITWTQIKATGTCNDSVGHCQTMGSGANMVTDTGIDESESGNTHILIQGLYNLWLGAIPTAAGTDLMVGTRNIYKCSITSSNPTCSSGFSWKNLTHVYECNPIAAPSHLHPDQHGFDFLQSNPAIMYFANDGGVYRSLNGAAGDGSCNTQAVFDNLDTNMGSTSEFVSFSQHPSDPGTILGGLQDNGSPAIFPPATGTLWTDVNNGDGGYNEIDPSNPSIWYTTNVFVSIQQCTSAPNCTYANFGLPPTFAGPNIGSTQVSSDTSEFYIPFKLDPAQPSNVIGTANANIVVGTCRVWRGPGAGGPAWSSANKISPMFDFASRGLPDPVPPALLSHCTDPTSGGQTLIRALAVGGPAPNGISQVIYAGLDTGGNAPGQVWVTFNADASSPNWTNVSAGISTTAPANPNLRFGISDVWIDKLDTTGQTAYVTVMGFGVPHIYKTTNGGSTWTNITANLPDAPADTVITDPDDAKTIYLGTDVGAFISKDSGSTWQVFGSGLPSVPVTRLRMFENGNTGQKMVRASTYGRGVWQIPTPADYVLSVQAISQRVVPSQQSIVFSGLLVPFNGYGSSVNVTCTTNNAPSGTSCTSNNPVVTPQLGGASISVTANAPSQIGTYVFTMQAVGTDPALTAHHQDLTLVVAADFSMAPSPTSATVTKGSTATYTINLTPLGNFANNTVNLSCSSGLPQGANCSFSQSAVTLATSAVPVTLSIGTRASRAQALNRINSGMFFAMLFPAFGMVLVGLNGGLRRRRARLAVFLLLTICLMLFAVGCGGGGSSTPPQNNGTPAGTYTITVLATAGSTQHTTTVTLTVQ